jgi:protocatechuate 3,4-dioxygenase beta subunit
MTARRAAGNPSRARWKRFGAIALATLVTTIAALVLLRTERPSPSRGKGGSSDAEPDRLRPRRLLGRSSEAPDPGAWHEPAGLIPSEDEPVGALSLRGRVVDDDARPVEGALVMLNAVPSRSVSSAHDGVFRFEGLLPRPYMVQARSGPLVAQAREVRVAAGAAEVTLVLRRAAALAAEVRNADDRRPIAGARIEAAGQHDLVATTDSDGNATIEGLGTGRHVIMASATGYASLHVPVFHDSRRAAGTRVALLLRPGTEVFGRAVDEGGAPIEGAVIQALQPGSASPSEDSGIGDRAVTDADGHWKIAALPAGTFRFTAVHEQFAPAYSAATIIDGRHPTGPVVITLRSGALLTGQTVDRGGEPVAFALVTARGAGVHRSTMTDHLGDFEMAGLARAKLQIEARASDATAPARTIDLTSGDADIVLALDSEGVIAGVVVDAQARPVSGAMVAAVPDDRGMVAQLASSRSGLYASSTSDEGGVFRLRGLSAGRYRLRAAAQDTVQSPRFWLQPSLLAEVGDEDVRIVLEASAKLHGLVELSDGDAAEHFAVALALLPPTEFKDTEGSFVIDEVPPGNHLITVTAPGHEPHKLDVQIAAGEDGDLGRIVLRPGRSIAGVVLDGNGSPVARATVLAGEQLLGDGSRPGGATLTTQSDEQGRFELSGVPAAPLTLLAEHPVHGRSAPLLATLAQGGEQVELRLGAVTALSGTVTSHGHPVAQAAVVATPTDVATGRFVVMTQADGRYRFERLAEGSYTITAALNPTPTMQLLQSVAAQVGRNGNGGEIDIDIQLGGPTLAVHVLEASGRPVDNAQVYLVSGSVQAGTLSQLEAALVRRGPGQTRVMLLMQGRSVTAADVAPGQYTLCAVAVRGQLEDPAVLQRIRDGAGELAALCRPAHVAPDPVVQQAVLQLGADAPRLTSP